MLKKFKILMWDLVWFFNHEIANYCYRKAGDFLLDGNAKWDKRAQAFVKREIYAFDKLAKLKYGEA